MSRLEAWVLAVGVFLFVTRFVGVVRPLFYRRIVDGILALPAGLMQLLGLLAILVGAVVLAVVVHEVAWLHLAGATIGIAFLAGGLLWLLPNVVRDLSHMIFFNRSPLVIRLICGVGAAVGLGFVAVVARSRGWLPF